MNGEKLTNQTVYFIEKFFANTHKKSVEFGKLPFCNECQLRYYKEQNIEQGTE